MNGELQPVVEGLGRIIIQHGMSDGRRALVYLATVVIALRDGLDLDGPGYINEKITAYWSQSVRTTEREASSWRKVTGGADVIEVARRVSAAMDEAGVAQVDVTGMALAGFVPIV